MSRTYQVYNPHVLLVCGGGNTSIEQVDPANDTVSTVVSSLLYNRAGSIGWGNALYSWIAGGSSQSSKVERITHSDLSAAVSSRADLPVQQGGGTSFYGTDECYLAGDIWADTVQKFTCSTETVVSINPTPTRIHGGNGCGDANHGWLVGGVKTDGSISSSVYQLDMTSGVWTTPSGYDLSGGRAYHGIFYKDHQVFVAGGIQSNSAMTIMVSKLDVSTGTGTLSPYVSLSLGRTHVGGISTPSQGYAVGGLNIGPKTLIDRTDLHNSSADAVARATLTYARYGSVCVGDLLFDQVDEIGGDLLCSQSWSLRYESTMKGGVHYATGMSPLILNTTFYLSGGQNYADIYSYIDSFDTTNDTSELRNSSLTPRYGGFGLSSDVYSWFIGGRSPSGLVLSTVERLDLASLSDAVSARASLSTGMSDGGCGTNSTHGYIQGSSVRKLDTSSETWTTLSDPGLLGTYSSGGATEESVVFAGGVYAGVKIDNIHKLDVSTNTWIAGSSLVNAVSGATTVASMESVWVAGGYRWGVVNMIQMFNPLTSSSRAGLRSHLNESRQKAVGFLSREHGWFVGGLRSAALDSTERLDIYNDTVDSVARGPLRLARSAAMIGFEASWGQRAIFGRSMCRSALTYSDRVFCLPRVPGLSDVSCITLGKQTVGGTLLASYYAPHQVDSTRLGYIRPAQPCHSDLSCILKYTSYAGYQASTSAVRPNTWRGALATVLEYTLVDADLGEGATWVAGGFAQQRVEKLDQSGWSTRGRVSVVRTGGSSVSAVDQGWFIGGDLNGTIERLTYANDMTDVTPRNVLLTPRVNHASSSDQQHGWIFGGTTHSGVETGTIERMDKTNDTMTLVSRGKTGTVRRSRAERSWNRVYNIGGEFGLGSTKVNWVNYVEVNNDTVIHSALPLAHSMSEHSVTEHQNLMFIQEGGDLIQFDPLMNIWVSHVNVLFFSRKRAGFDRSRRGLTLVGGVVGSYTTSGSEIIDPSTLTITVGPSLNYNRSDHWTVTEMAPIIQGGPTRSAVLASKDRKESSLSCQLNASSGQNTQGCMIHAVKDRQFGQLSCQVVMDTWGMEDPLGDNLHCVFNTKQRTYSTMRMMVTHPVTWNELPSVVVAAIQAGTTRGCISQSYEESTFQCRVASQDQKFTTRDMFLPLSVEGHWSDLAQFTSASFRAESTLEVALRVIQQQSQITCWVKSPSYSRLSSTRQGIVYSGGRVTTRRGFVHLATSVYWGYTTTAGSEEILNGMIEAGEANKLWGKVVLDTPESVDVSKISMEILMSHSSEKEFIYLVDSSQDLPSGLAVGELTKPGLSFLTLVVLTQQPHLFIRLMDTTESRSLVTDRIVRIQTDRDWNFVGQGVIDTQQGINILRIYFSKEVAEGETLRLTIDNRVAETAILLTNPRKHVPEFFYN